MKAEFSQCGQYRYLLERQLSEAGSLQNICFIMLNPSIANAIENDSTITRCIRFAEKWGYRKMTVVNLFALVSTDPKNLYISSDPIGPENNKYIKEALNEAEKIIVAWGNHGLYKGRDAEIRTMILDNNLSSKAYQIGELTEKKCPRHPLYLDSRSPLCPFL